MAFRAHLWRALRRTLLLWLLTVVVPTLPLLGPRAIEPVVSVLGFNLGLDALSVLSSSPAGQ